MPSFRDAPVRTSPGTAVPRAQERVGSPPAPPPCPEERRHGSSALPPAPGALLSGATGAHRRGSADYRPLGTRRFATLKSGVASPGPAHRRRAERRQVPGSSSQQAGCNRASQGHRRRRREGTSLGARRGDPGAERAWMGQRVPADPYLRAGGRLPAARSLREAGGAWSCPRERRALPLPTAVRQRRRLGSDGLSLVSDSSCGG